MRPRGAFHGWLGVRGSTAITKAMVFETAGGPGNTPDPWNRCRIPPSLSSSPIWGRRLYSKLHKLEHKTRCSPQQLCLKPLFALKYTNKANRMRLHVQQLHATTIQAPERAARPSKQGFVLANAVAEQRNMPYSARPIALKKTPTAQTCEFVNTQAKRTERTTRNRRCIDLLQILRHSAPSYVTGLPSEQGYVSGHIFTRLTDRTGESLFGSSVVSARICGVQGPRAGDQTGLRPSLP
ncbi:hypothetical protein BU26DRAFT_64758 [Trematosphaeria pertusa]|uniref:Uncharacterized protein n=1 Tax=Trematosphaeria pertusa TaxID=390896 RepID=A0A6A6I809_9PLEO|nr:uncharacterized protein BU26DRAFT_64758 [Trematosphaeria pertusa]KAF2246218.1 hypothetical protein BU26DRAFT_64758 [Trematosphaeria pertusa]